MARDLKSLLDCRFGKKHLPNDYGIWEVKGEDPNCDFGGYHHQPHLGFFEGTFKDVCKHALTLTGFFQWGSGGDVVKAPADIKSATTIGNGGKQRHRKEAIETLLHDPVEFAKDRLGREYEDDETVEVKFCDLVKMLKEYEKDIDKNG